MSNDAEIARLESRTDDASSAELTRRFTAGPVERRKLRIERLAAALLGGLTIALVLPLVGILSVLMVKAWPALSWAFITENPQNYMTAGGVWAPLVGTFYLIFISLAVAAPVGI